MRMNSRGSYTGLSLLVAVLLLAGCNSESGGIGGGGSSVSLATLTGLWEGDILGANIVSGQEVEAAMLYNGDLLMVDNTNVVYAGAYVLNSSTQFQAEQVRRYNPGNPATPGFLRFAGVLGPDNSSASGQLLVITVTEVGGTLTSEQIQLQPDNDYQRTSSLTLVSGTWQDGVSPSLTLDISQTGIVLLQQGACSYGGQISTPNAQRNLYEITLGGATIGCAGSLTGFAALYDNETLLRIIVAGNSGALHLALARP